ncbi:amidohydrolase family protein [Hyphococcus luteus]|uniref:Amidohydrolase n=1 Tax=Hyphococcus luteus TaxID=2058213 RepID=A0A2S7K0J5_9PROT|nr:amidohydrolase family protein [Marinicaulis flavus]PQA85996.1 amidohydrolase [Marinicaulis flavus]
MQGRGFKGARVFLVLILAIGACSGTAFAAEVKNFTVIAAGEKVGSLSATIDGNVTEIDYIVRNNGRGPKISERIVTDKKGRVLDWSIEGEALFGGEITETYAWENGRAQWRSEADSGVTDAEVPGIYIANDASPWENGVYAKALVKAGLDEAPVLPGGAIRLQRLGEDRLGEGRDSLPVVIYAISSLDLHPNFFMLDRDGDFAAEISGGAIAIREGYEDEAPRLAELARKLNRDVVEGLEEQLAHKYDAPVHYQNVRIFDPKNGVTTAPAQVTVFQGRIAAIDYDNPAAAPRDGEVVIDGEGGVLVPGLHDMHTHSTIWSGLYYLAAGVTSTRDQGNNPQDIIKLAADINAGVLPGPRIVRNGFIEGRSPYSSRTAFIADTLDQALSYVRWYADHGFFQIKLYNSAKPEWVKPLAAEAHRLGLKVSGHVPAFMSPDDAIRAGYDDIAHMNQLVLGWLLEEGEDTRTTLRLTALTRAAYLDLDEEKVRDTIALMKEHNVALDTTNVIIERIMLSRAGEVADGDKPYLSHAPIGYQRYRKRSYVSLEDPETDREYRDSMKKMIKLTGILHRNGVTLLPGTDDTTGFTVHRELELYAKAGIPNAEVLRIATLGSEAYLNNDQDAGSIETGKVADFFLIPHDPVKDISNVRDVRLVSRGDRIYYPSEIYDALSFRPFAKPPEVEVR